MKKIGYTEEAPGVKSANRLMFVLGLSWLMALTTYGIIFLKWSSTELIAVFSAVAGVLYGGKLIQKPMEKAEVTNTETSNTHNTET